ncbi:MAG: hybrid sensor histidine kinase/response regulator [Alphaproteobacteria bacterium]|nr:hybrid sensor histidine kinase/response regulator [Alphaproteobacteria bacterium]
MDDLLRDFLTETNENMAQLDLQLVELEQNPNNPGLLSSIFRLVHTIKGTCGFLGLPRLEKVAHASENVLGKFRDGVLPVTPAAVTLIFRSLDQIKSLLAVLEATEKEPDGNDADLIQALNDMSEGKGLDVAVAAAASAAPEPQETPAPEPVAEAAPEPERVAAPAAQPAPAKAAPAPVAAAPAADHAEAKDSAVAASSVRLSVDLLENLMTQVSELVLARNQLMQLNRTQKDSVFTTSLQRLNHIVSELQDGVMKTRMQPIGNAWTKLPRIIRDLSRELNKKIDLVMLGAETELDRQVLELIKDPLTHMVRNSADHGIELPADRVAAGKPETGTVTLNAYHEGGHIIIEIKDDGKGLAIEKIKAKAIQNGLATEADISGMSDQQIMQFIFKPGFSTAAAVTSVSGRGVGMDVVRTNVEKIGGTIEMFSTVGKGSRFQIKIPLTLAIVSALIVEVAEDRYAIPQLNVVELVRASENSEYKIEYISNTPVLRLRNRLLPLVSLAQLMQLPITKSDVHKGFVVVAQVGNSLFGIMVDRVFDTEEIVVKPVSRALRHITLFSGNTILGDGSVVMILDPNGIAAHAGDIQSSNNAQTDTAAKSSVVRQGSKQSLLLFRAGSAVPKAVPLSLVARLEDFDVHDIEHANGRALIQYRGHLMPIVAIAPEYQLKQEGRQAVLVFSDRDHSMGLAVDEILDIVDEAMNIELTGDRTGQMGTAIIAGKATEIIDVGYFLDKAFGDWFDPAHEGAFNDPQSRNRILLVDDSAFFRNLLTPVLTLAGYQVTTAENPKDAMKYYEEGMEFDAIVSDIEMPQMSGFDFVSQLRREGRWSKLPVIAMSSHTNPRDLERGAEVGFNDYVAKFDREGLLQVLHQHIRGGGAAS